MSAQPDFGHTTFAQERRTDKAIRLEVFLRGRGVTAAKAQAMSQADRRFVERAAGIRRCSDETWELAARLIRNAEEGPS